MEALRLNFLLLIILGHDHVPRTTLNAMMKKLGLSRSNLAERHSPHRPDHRQSPDHIWLLAKSDFFSSRPKRK